MSSTVHPNGTTTAQEPVAHHRASAPTAASDQPSSSPTLSLRAGTPPEINSFLPISPSLHNMIPLNTSTTKRSSAASSSTTKRSSASSSASTTKRSSASSSVSTTKRSSASSTIRTNNYPDIRRERLRQHPTDPRKHNLATALSFPFACFGSFCKIQCKTLATNLSNVCKTKEEIVQKREPRILRENGGLRELEVMWNGAVELDGAFWTERSAGGKDSAGVARQGGTYSGTEVDHVVGEDHEVVNNMINNHNVGGGSSAAPGLRVNSYRHPLVAPKVDGGSAEKDSSSSGAAPMTPSTRTGSSTNLSGGRRRSSERSSSVRNSSRLHGGADHSQHLHDPMSVYTADGRARPSQTERKYGTKPLLIMQETGSVNPKNGDPKFRMFRMQWDCPYNPAGTVEGISRLREERRNRRSAARSYCASVLEEEEGRAGGGGPSGDVEDGVRDVEMGDVEMRDVGEVNLLEHKAAAAEQETTTSPLSSTTSSEGGPLRESVSVSSSVPGESCGCARMLVPGALRGGAGDPAGTPKRPQPFSATNAAETSNGGAAIEGGKQGGRQLPEASSLDELDSARRLSSAVVGASSTSWSPLQGEFFKNQKKKVRNLYARVERDRAFKAHPHCDCVRCVCAQLDYFRDPKRMTHNYM